MEYIVMNADVIHSRKKHFMREDFECQMKELNETFFDSIVVKFTIIKGDEIQGLLKKGANVFPIIRMMKLLLSPFELRIGIGVGTIYEKQINVSNSFELNGEAFFRARDAVDYMKETKRKKDFIYRIYFNTGNESLDNQLNLSYSFVDDILSKWKTDMFEIASLEEKGYKYEEIAKLLLKTNNLELISKERVNITKKIQRSNWYKIKQMEKLLFKLMKEGIR